jgi:hypothetical protein
MTTEAKHTQGPWIAIKAPHGPIDIFDANDRDVVTVYGGGVPEDREANARLIAAAPDLLEVVEAFEAFYPSGINPDLDKASNKARAALVKARGQ